MRRCGALLGIALSLAAASCTDSGDNPATETPPTAESPRRDPTAKRPEFMTSPNAHVSEPLPVAEALTTANIGSTYVFVLEMSTGLVRTVKTIVPASQSTPAEYARWLDDETLVFAVTGGAYEVPIDGPARFVAQDAPPVIRREVSADGAYAVRGSVGIARGGHGEVTVTALSGQPSYRIDDVEATGWSAEGHLFAFQAAICAGAGLSVLDPATGSVRLLIEGVNLFVWRPGTTSVVTNSEGLSMADAASGAIEVLLPPAPGGGSLVPFAFSPNGQRLTFAYALPSVGSAECGEVTARPTVNKISE